MENAQIQEQKRLNERYRNALKVLVHHGVEGEMVAFAHTEGDGIIFLTNQLDKAQGKMMAFGYGDDKVPRPGYWTPVQDREVVEILWNGLEKPFPYTLHGFHMNPTCRPTPAHQSR